MMCELPSNAVLADRFLDHFDGFSIGSNDMTQLTLGLDRDSALVAAGFDERDPAVKHMLSLAISACKKRGKYVGICGQGPSAYPDLAEWLLQQGIESMSLNPDTVIETWLRLGALIVAKSSIRNDRRWLRCTRRRTSWVWLRMELSHHDEMTENALRSMAGRCPGVR
jgi:pyruvate,water dikinase